MLTEQRQEEILRLLNQMHWIKEARLQKSLEER